ncbi:PAS domain S-box protein [Mucilaginibacter sp. UR6-11]|uniref:PAS domain S-box protein n=1 Tax=Mucilaginibacter sp. UR6-11 TaxID=1435644 RepID=UPI001E63B068|nr:PAS domain S-box protein [Mucilaginibacter sp. UR6-11]MCC8426349.1 PAS domain S-box protein [Mucilaginibacter sp. UR6-11]
MWKRAVMNIWRIRIFSNRRAAAPIVHFGVTKRSDRLINYFLTSYFLLGLILTPFHGTLLVAVSVGGLSLVVYYSAKNAFPGSCLYQYVLSVVLGIFMAQFIYQLHGMFEMHFFAFIGSALLITYQNWKLQLPLLLFILLYHFLFNYLHNAGVPHIYFSQSGYLNWRTFTIHILLTGVICFICGLCAFQLHQYHQIQLVQTEQMTKLQEAARLAIVSDKNAEALEEKNMILESIGDAFFALDKNWTVTYWNRTAEKALQKSKQEIVGQNLWEAFPTAVNSAFYRKYHQAMKTGRPVHFEDYFALLNCWYEVSAFPSPAGLSVYFKDISERKKNISDLKESEQRYSDVFHFSPLPMWVVNLESLAFMDVNKATLTHYGYTRKEFLAMTLRDIRPENQLENMQHALDQGSTEPDIVYHRQMVHRKKNGELINMEIQIAPFQFKGVKTSIVIATDMTEQLRYVEAIEQQNEKLMAISWMQSHVIRAPLARIMGLIPMFIDPKTSVKEKRAISVYLVQSANELDQVIRNIIEVTGAGTLNNASENLSEHLT